MNGFISLPKYVSLFAAVLFLITVSCENTYDKQMNEIEQMLEAHPSSALKQLLTINSKKLHPESRRARYALLKSLALDKSYIDVTDDSLSLLAARYYATHGDIRSRMLAYYSLGIVQKNAGNNTEAIISFLQAKEIAEAIPDKHYYGLITRNMAILYKDSHDYETAKYYYQESAKAFRNLGEQLYAAYSVLGDAGTSMAQGEYVYADSLLGVLEAYAREERRNDLLAAVLMDEASILISPGRKNPEKAVLLFREAGRLGFPPSNTWGYGTLAVAYENLRQEDSSNHYLALAEKKARNLSDSVALFNTLYSINMLRGRMKEAHEYINNGVNLHNKLVFKRENQQLADAISSYSRQVAYRQLSLARYRLVLLVFAIVSVVLLLCIMLLLIHNHRRQMQLKNLIILEKEQKLEEDVTLIQDISEQLQNVQDTSSEMARTINELIGERITILKSCADAYEAVNSTPANNLRNPYRYLDEDPLQKKKNEMRQFLQALEEFRKDETLFVVLEESVNRWRGNIMQRLRQACTRETMDKPLFSEEDFRIILLFYAGIPDRTIAFLMDMTCAAIRTRKSRYKERLVQNDIPDGDYYVRELAFFPKI